MPATGDRRDLTPGRAGLALVLARVAGVDWKLAQTPLGDKELEAPAVPPGGSHQFAPRFRRRAQYTSFCVKYREFAPGVSSARCARSTSPARSSLPAMPAPPLPVVDAAHRRDHPGLDLDLRGHAQLPGQGLARLPQRPDARRRDPRSGRALEPQDRAQKLPVRCATPMRPRDMDTWPRSERLPAGLAGGPKN